MKYRTEIDVSDATLGSIDAIIEAPRTVGYPELDWDGASLAVVFDVEPGGVAEDLWDLRTVVEELEANLSSYISYPKIPKPELVEAA